MADDFPEHMTVANTRHLGRFSIFLNGVEVHDVFEAHRGEGWLIRAARDPAGRLFRDGDEIAKQRLSGKITIVRKVEADHG